MSAINGCIEKDVEDSRGSPGVFGKADDPSINNLAGFRHSAAPSATLLPPCRLKFSSSLRYNPNNDTIPLEEKETREL